MTLEGKPPELSRQYSDYQLLLIFKAMLDIYHRRVIQLQIQSESEEVYSHSYGTTKMTSQDRLMNRLTADLVYTEQGIASHDDEALRWISRCFVNDFFELNQDLIEHGLPAGAVGMWTGYQLDNKYWLVFNIRHKYKGFWLDRSLLYRTEMPDDWTTEPVLHIRSEHYGILSVE